MQRAIGIKKLIAWLLLLEIGILCLSFPVQATPPSKHIFAKNRDKTKQVALTFDDGPHPRYTPEILDILEEYQITATFFVIGINAFHYPNILSRIANSGCEIGNHTYSHLNLTNTDTKKIENEILDCESIILDQAGVTPKVFRPPEGHFDQTVTECMDAMDYKIILWSIDTKDWAHTPTDQIVRNVISHLDSGDIILMHDYISGENTTCDALRIMIPMILKMGYEFVTVSELINGANV